MFCRQLLPVINTHKSTFHWNYSARVIPDFRVIFHDANKQPCDRDQSIETTRNSQNNFAVFRFFFWRKPKFLNVALMRNSFLFRFFLPPGIVVSVNGWTGGWVGGRVQGKRRERERTHGLWLLLVILSCVCLRNACFGPDTWNIIMMNIPAPKCQCANASDTLCECLRWILHSDEWPSQGTYVDVDGVC